MSTLWRVFVGRYPSRPIRIAAGALAALIAVTSSAQAQIWLASSRSQPEIAELTGAVSANRDPGQIAAAFVAAVVSDSDRTKAWSESSQCHADEKRLDAIRDTINRLAVQRLRISSLADRYLVNDRSVSWNQFKAAIDGIERGVKSLAAELSAEPVMKILDDPALKTASDAFMVSLTDGKQGLLHRMEAAMQDVDRYIRSNSPVMGQKAEVAREAEAVRAEATKLAAAADGLGAFLSKIRCRS